MNRTRSIGTSIPRFKAVAGSGIGSNINGTTPVPSTSIPRLTCIRARARSCGHGADGLVSGIRACPDLAHPWVIRRSGMLNRAGDLAVLSEIQQRVLAETVEPNSAPRVAVADAHRDHPNMHRPMAAGV